MRSQNGFTLIELMIVVGIIAILTSIVLPTYKDYVVRGKIPDATSNLAAKRIAMEQYFQDNRRYSTIAGGAICGGSNPTSSNNSSPTFTFSCVATDITFTATATGANTMNGFIYTIDQDNNKKTPTVPPGWTFNNNCWVTQKGGAC